MNAQSSARLIVLAAGGTGGHVFPAEALAKELIARGNRLALVTDKRGAAYGGTLGEIDTYSISAQGLTGHGVLGIIKGAFSLATGLWQARKLLEGLRPAVVVGFGGYASAPTVYAATQLGIPTVIHEQNAILGRANRLLASRVNRVCTSIDLAKPAAEGAVVVRTGMPVRPAIAEKRATPYVAPTAEDHFKLVVLGGSQGARVFSDVIPEAMKLLPESLRKRMEIAQQCRPEELDRTLAAYHDAGDAHVQLRVFFDNVPELLANAHLLIARSGASTVAEACVIGRPSLLVPYPYAADNHQAFNADALAAAGGGWALRQNQFTPKALADLIAQFANSPAALAKAAGAATSFALPDAASRLADVVSTMMRGEDGARAPAKASPPISTHTMNRGIV